MTERRWGSSIFHRKAAARLVRCVVAGVFALVPFALKAEDATSTDPYAALSEILKVTEKKIEVADCRVRASVDFESYKGRLGTFREAWLNKDCSLDFYAQRGRQVFAYSILKRVAEILTEGLYNGRQQPECRFALDIVYNDKFGQEKWPGHSGVLQNPRQRPFEQSDLFSSNQK